MHVPASGPCKCLKRSPCDTGQNTSVVPDVHIQPLYLLGTKAQTILFNEPGDIAVRQTEDKAEAQRRAFPSDQSETVFPEIFPERVFRKLRVCVKKIFLYISVNVECVECL